MKLQSARVKAIEKAAVVKLRREPRAIGYVRHPDGRTEIQRKGRFEAISQAEIDEISAEPGSLVIELQYDAEAFSCPTSTAS